ncbi:2-phosphosulfolactate phosphatase [Actinoplanes sp. NBRC 101535]|uniref:2-phosphosulfolactate phosphatase n=1 Tax=Actinoplanes sp. NBRC 101535 TaxID=3032196 RepID=UPI0025538660|nr:2-phosphosulfolactate phosphatase [Actinoplanes sp. NBRC 101535]
MTDACFRQTEHLTRFEWGPTGAAAVASGAAYVAVIDVLSFTTALTVAAEHDIAVLPYRWRDATAATTAAAHDADLAVGRSQAGPDDISLSPPTIPQVASRRTVHRLVLPSPNGSTVSALLAESGATVVGVSLRNATAAAAWVRAQAAGRPIAVVAAGERWPDGSLRPAIEDLWGAGAFLNALPPDGLSPEAGVAVAAYRAVADTLGTALAASASGRELTTKGFTADVTIAAQLDATTAVPVLHDGWFHNAASSTVSSAAASA